MAVIRRRIYNPGHLTPDELKASFVAREDTLAELLRVIREQTPGRPCQHMMLIGPRGMGKTTLGLRLLYAVEEDPDLRARWQPVAFHEESYGIASLADFWCHALRHLTRATGESQWEERAEVLLADEGDLERAAAYALAELMDFSRDSGKRLILFVESLDAVIGQINDEREIHSLRAALIERSEILLLGSANAFFDAIDGYGEPLYEFFRVFKLEGIGQEEARRILEAVAISEGRTEVSESPNMEHGRLEIIRRLTGGNLRLLALACRLLIESPMGSAIEDLERLIDEQTPYFKARTEYLPGQARKVFHCLSEGWKPLLAKEVAAKANLGSSHASAQLKQLSEKGYTREVRLPGTKRTRYEVSDRFYNIYYLLRFSRSGRGRLERLAEFLHDLFGPNGMARGGNRTEALSGFEQALSVGRGQSREHERPRLAQSMIRAVAAGHAGRVKQMMEDTGLVESMEPLWHAVRVELGEELEALPAEILDAVSVIRETVAGATMAPRP